MFKYLLLNYETLKVLLNSKTERKVLSALIEYGQPTLVKKFRIDELKKKLGYKNKSTISRALKNLNELGIIRVFTDRKGCTIYFSNSSLMI